MSKHTPGPWIVNKLRYRNGDIDVLAFNPKEKDECYQHSALATVMGHTQNHGDWRDRTCEEVTANARLIAAAPEMFDMIRKINAHLVRPGTLGDLIDDADKLIEKIEGRS